MILSVTSCQSDYSGFYGAWYYDKDGQRDAIQFSANDDGKNVFIWAKYDIESDTVLSISKGYFSISDNTVILEYNNSDFSLTLDYSFVDDKLILSSETASLTLTKKTLDE